MKLPIFSAELLCICRVAGVQVRSAKPAPQ